MRSKQKVFTRLPYHIDTGPRRLPRYCDMKSESFFADAGEVKSVQPTARSLIRDPGLAHRPMRTECARLSHDGRRRRVRPFLGRL
jgi:hypothetical protein